MIRLAAAILFGSLASLPLAGTVPSAEPERDAVPLAPVSEATAQPAPRPPKPEPPRPPTVEQALHRGVLIVVSKRSQQAHVFKDGVHWGSSPVSTGRRGHATPAGVFPILQKKVHHRSNLYGGARMPYMQRLTWDGVALHAGHVPGYPASHGCIRLPARFAKALFGLTSASTTAVLIANERLATHRDAHRLAGGDGLPGSGAATALARADTAPPAPWAASGATQTIQLAAATSPDEAAALWQRLQRQRPALATLSEAIVPAVVNGRQYYRLRAKAPGAHGLCGELRRDGVACLKVAS